MNTCIPLLRINRDVTLHCNARRAYEKSLTYVEYQNFEHLMIFLYKTGTRDVQETVEIVV